MIMLKNLCNAKYIQQFYKLSLLFVIVFIAPTSAYSALTFTPSANVNLAESGQRELISADFNQDGNIDVIASEFIINLSSAPPVIEILFGDGNGGILDVTTLATNSSGTLDFLVDGIAVGFVDADKVLDLAATAGLSINDPIIANQTYIYKGILTGTKYEFSNATTAAIKIATLVTSSPSHDVVIGQFNNDMNMDVIVLHENGLSLFLGPISGLMTTAIEIITTPMRGKIISAQMNESDRFLDVITEIGVFFSNNDNTFTQSNVGIGLGLSGTKTEAIAVGNFNGDNNLDIAYTNNYSATTAGQQQGAQLVLMIASGSGTNISYTKKLSPIIQNTVFSGLATGDLDSPANNIDEVVLLDYNADSLQVYSNLNNPVIANPVSIVISPPTPLNPRLIVLEDMNGDSRLDVVTSNDGDLVKGKQSLSIFVQTGTTSESVNFFPNNYVTPVPLQTTKLDIIVQRNFSSNTEISVEYSVLDGTAKNGVDFNAVTETQILTFLANETTKIISLDILPTNNFVNKNFSIQLQDLTNQNTTQLVPLNETASITIQGKAIELPVITFSKSSYSQPEDSTVAIIEPVTITRTLPQSFVDAGQTVSSVTVKSVLLIATDAANAADFTAVNKIYTFNNLETTLNISLNITNDTIVEGPENFNLVLSNPTNSTLSGKNTSTITIADDDVEAPINEIPEAVDDSYDVVFDSNKPSLALEIQAPGVLVNDKDKETLNTDLTARLVGTAITGLTFRPDGSFRYLPQAVGTVTFSYVVNDGSDDSPAAIVTINVKSVDQIIYGTFSLDNNTYTVAEDIGQLILKVARSSGTGAVKLNYSLINKSAIVESDFIDNSTTPGVLNFTASDLSQSIIIDIVADTISENDEDFTVSLDSVSAGLISNTNRSKIVTIIGSPGIFSFDTNNVYTVNEQAGLLTIKVMRMLGTTGEVVVNYVIDSGSAVAGSDFNDNTEPVGVLTFAAGVNSMSILIAIVSDVVPEENEQFSITLKTVSAGQLSDSNISQVVTITENSGGGTSSSSSSSGGGGCVLQMNASFDPVLVLLLLLFLMKFIPVIFLHVKY